MDGPCALGHPCIGPPDPSSGEQTFLQEWLHNFSPGNEAVPAPTIPKAWEI